MMLLDNAQRSTSSGVEFGLCVHLVQTSAAAGILPVKLKLKLKFYFRCSLTLVAQIMIGKCFFLPPPHAQLKPSSGGKLLDWHAVD
jgi:hypothetical protein